jgi:small subunit ribosomal protein S7
MQIPGRDVKPDIKYNSKLLGKLINYIMLEGKKSTAERIVYDALAQVEKRAARERGEHTMASRLAAEVMDASRKEGKAYNKRLDVHRMAEAHRAFAHYRW